jgi:hypothetical protein
MNDICYLKLHSKLELYADDTTASYSGKDADEIIPKRESDLITINNWLSHNRLIINVAKTQALYFNWRQNWKKKDFKNLKINFNNSDVYFVKEARLLSVIIDTDPSFKPHIETVCKKVNTTHLLSRSRSLFPKDFELTLFKLFIIPYFDYCSTIFQHATSKKTYINQLKRSFSKSLYKITKIKIGNLTLKEQLDKLTEFNILPLKLRFFTWLSKSQNQP